MDIKNPAWKIQPEQQSKTKPWKMSPLRRSPGPFQSTVKDLTSPGRFIKSASFRVVWPWRAYAKTHFHRPLGLAPAPVRCVGVGQGDNSHSISYIHITMQPCVLPWFADKEHLTFTPHRLTRKVLVDRHKQLSNWHILHRVDVWRAVTPNHKDQVEQYFQLFSKML